MIKLAHIAAASENDVIGSGGQLPWDIPEDMKFFKDTTRGHAVIMGRKTYESMGKPLPKRLNVVVTRTPNYDASGAKVVSTLQEAYAYCEQHAAQWGNLVFIIGGGEIYAESLNDVDLVFLTRIHRTVDGDAKYPKLDLSLFKEISRREREGFTFLTFERSQPRVPGTFLLNTASSD